MTDFSLISDPLGDLDINTAPPAGSAIGRGYGIARRLFARRHRRRRPGRPGGPASPGQRHEGRRRRRRLGRGLHPRRLCADQQPRRQRRAQDRGRLSRRAQPRRQPGRRRSRHRPRRIAARRRGPGLCPARRFAAAAGRPAGGRDRQPVRLSVHGHGRRRQRPRPLAAHPLGAADRQRDPDRRGA